MPAYGEETPVVRRKLADRYAFYQGHGGLREIGQDVATSVTTAPPISTVAPATVSKTDPETAYRAKMADIEKRKQALQAEERKLEQESRLEPRVEPAQMRDKVFTLETGQKKVIKLPGRTVELIDERGSGWMTEDDWKSWYSHVRHVGEHNARDRQRAAQETGRALIQQGEDEVRRLADAEQNRLNNLFKAEIRAKRDAIRKKREALDAERKEAQREFGIDVAKAGKREQMEEMLEKLKGSLTMEEFLKIKAEFEAALVEEEKAIESQADLDDLRNKLIDTIKKDLRVWQRANPIPYPQRKTVYTSKTADRMSFKIPAGSFEVMRQDGSGWMKEGSWPNWNRLVRHGEHRRAKERQLEYNAEAGDLMAQAMAEQTKIQDQWEKDKVAAKKTWLTEKNDELEKLIEKHTANSDLPQAEVVKLKDYFQRVMYGENAVLQKEEEEANAVPEYPRILSETDEERVMISAEGTVYKMVNRDGSGWMTEGDWLNWFRRVQGHDYRSAEKHKAGYTAKADALASGATANQADDAGHDAYQTVSHEQHKAEQEKGFNKLMNDAKSIAADVGKTALDVLGGPEGAAAAVIGIAALAVLVPLIVIILKKYLASKDVEVDDAEAKDMAQTIVKRRETDLTGIKNQLEAGKITENTFNDNVTAVTVSEANKMIAEAKAEEQAKTDAASAARKRKLYLAGGGAAVAGTAALAFVAWLMTRNS